MHRSQERSFPGEAGKEFIACTQFIFRPEPVGMDPLYFLTESVVESFHRFPPQGFLTSCSFEQVLVVSSC
jgi:hypothetical protein